MTAGRESRNRRWGGLILALLGVIGAIYLGAGARDAALDTAVRQASAGLASRLGPQASGDPQMVVHRLVTTNASAMAFLTVRNNEHRLVASDGAWSHWFTGMASRATVRTWRAWMYRTLCAETYRSIPDGAALHAGVPWWRVLASAGAAFWLALLLSALGLVVFERERRKDAKRPGPDDAATPGTVVGRRRRGPGGAVNWRQYGQRIRSRAGRGNSNAASATAPAAGFEPIGQQRRSHAPGALTPVAPPSSADDGTPSAAAQPRAGEAVVAPTAQVMPDSVPEDANKASSSGQYLLRFQPIWRGAMDGLLAGAAVRFVPADDVAARPLTVDELVANAGGADDAWQVLAEWLTRRLVTLQANWRTLELPRVPLMVALPDAIFTFEQAGGIWDSALSRYEPAPGDLVFCVERVPEMASGALPVRWAVTEPHSHDSQPWYRLKAAGIDAEPDQYEGDDALSATGAGESRFVMPADAAWAADNAQRPLSPRAFARLMSRSELAPL